MTWNPIDDPVDYIVLANQRSPGLAEVTGAGIPRNWDKIRGHGGMGAIAVFHGMDLAEFSVKLRLYSTQDWDDWHAWKSIVDKPPAGGDRSRALDIVHPLLAQLDIKSVVVKEVMQPEQEDDGVWMVEIKFMQFRKPTFRLARPEGSTATPVDPVEQEIGKLTGQYQKLAAQ